MTMIHQLRWQFTPERGVPVEHQKFVAGRIKALKEALRTEIHGTTSDRSLRLATWNLMHFGNSGGYQRTAESMLYIAEIIDHFDLVAVQEVNRNLTALENLLENHLGNGWDYLVTDTTGAHEGNDAGNSERLAFLYRKSKVQFLKETGEIVLPEGQEIAAPDATGATRKLQFARTPFSVAFRAGWLKFKLCTVHIFYGEESVAADMAQRRDEIAKIAKWLADRQDGEAKAMVDNARTQGWNRPQDAAWDANYILLGDFNIVSPQHETMQALDAAGFETPTRLQSTNLGVEKRHYDQIATRAKHPGFKVVKSGVFKMLDHVYRDVDAAHYIDVVKPEKVMKTDKGVERDRDAKIKYFKQYFRKHQMSDHQLLWCEVNIDYSDGYLDEIINP